MYSVRRELNKRFLFSNVPTAESIVVHLLSGACMGAGKEASSWDKDDIKTVMGVPVHAKVACVLTIFA